jgi:hypothetical protein
MFNKKRLIAVAVLVIATPIEEWRSNVESRRSQPTECSKLPVVFKSK